MTKCLYDINNNKSAQYTDINTCYTFHLIATGSLGPSNESACKFMLKLGCNISFLFSDDGGYSVLFRWRPLRFSSLVQLYYCYIIALLSKRINGHSSLAFE